MPSTASLAELMKRSPPRRGAQGGEGALGARPLQGEEREAFGRLETRTPRQAFSDVPVVLRLAGGVDDQRQPLRRTGPGDDQVVDGAALVVEQSV